MFRPPVVALAVLVTSACQSTSEPSLPPLTRLAVHELEARAELSSVGVGADPLAPEPGAEPSALGERQRLRHAQRRAERIVVSLELVKLEPEAAASLTGWRAGDERAFTTPAWDAERVLRRAQESEFAEVVASSRIALFVGERGALEMVDQRAYVREFVFEYGDGGLLADPVVDTFLEGLALEVLGLPAADGRIELDLELWLADLSEPIPEHATRALPGGAPLTIQQPVALRQRLRTKAACGADECLVLVAQSLDGSDRLLFAVFGVERVQGGERHPSRTAPRIAGASLGAHVEADELPLAVAQVEQPVR